MNPPGGCAQWCVLLIGSSIFWTLSCDVPSPPLVLALLLPLPPMAAERLWWKPGETLSQIAERYGVSHLRLMQLNSIRAADLNPNGHQPAPAGDPARRPAQRLGRGTYRVKTG